MEINEKFESDTLTKIIPALIKAQQTISKIELNKKGNFGYYADLASCFCSIKPILLDNDITFSQPIMEVEGKLYLYTILRHTSGEYLKSRIELIRTPDNNMQKLGGQITYARRYAILGIMGAVGDEDDDGQSQADDLNLISEGQLKWIKDLLSGWPNLTAKILKKENVSSLEELKRSEFGRIKDGVVKFKADNGTDK